MPGGDRVAYMQLDGLHHILEIIRVSQFQI